MNTSNNPSTVLKTFKILNLFLEKDHFTFGEIEARLGFNKSTLSRFLSVLVGNDYLRKDESGQYELGLTIFALGNRAKVEDHLRTAALPIMGLLSEDTGMTVHLGILDRLRVVIIAKVNPQRGIQMVSRIGSSVPAHCTGQGKTILAFSPEATVRKVLETNGMKGFTPTTITTVGAFLEECVRIRARGFTIDDSEHEPGIRCIAVPVLDGAGQVAAALSVSSMASDLPDADAMERIAGMLLRARDKLREKMHYTR